MLSRRSFVSSMLAVPVLASAQQPVASASAPAGDELYRVGVTDIDAPEGRGKISRSLEQLIYTVDVAAQNKVQLLVLPELAVGGFDYLTADVAWWKSVRGNKEYADAIKKLRKHIFQRKVATFFGAAAEIGEDLYNALYFVGPQADRAIMVRRKFSPPETMGAPAFSQGYPFNPASDCVKLAHNVKVAPLICAEVVGRSHIGSVLNSGANIVVIASAWMDLVKEDMRDFAIRRYAAVNGFALMSNTRNPGLTTRAMIAAKGDILVDETPEYDTLTYADLNLRQRTLMGHHSVRLDG